MPTAAVTATLTVDQQDAIRRALLATRSYQLARPGCHLHGEAWVYWKEAAAANVAGLRELLEAARQYAESAIDHPNAETAEAYRKSLTEILAARAELG